MAIAPEGPKTYPLADLSPEQFEKLTFLLARGEDPVVVHVRAKDHGLDVRLPDRKGHTVRGWQAKRFTGPINWNQCEESARRALAFWRPVRITFAFPKVLSGGEQTEFRTRLIDEFPHLRLDWWDETEIQRRIRDTQDGQRAANWLFSNPEADHEAMLRALALGGELSDAEQAVGRIGEVQKFMDRDPHLRYTTVASSQGAPETPMAKETLLSIEAELEGQRVRFDGSERYPGAVADAGLGGQLSFSDDEDGQRARAALEQVLCEGGTIEVTSGMSADFGPVPVGLRGLMPDEPVTGQFEVSAGENLPASRPNQPILVRAGETELGLVLVAMDPADEWETTAAGSTGGCQ